MAEHHIGLDIGSFAVRAAEVSLEGGVTVLHRFAQITLPPRAVVEGEIADPTVVAAAIRDLWTRGGFKSNRVVVGVSTHNVKVRQAEVPDLPPDEVRAMLRYEAHDLMPASDADALFDFLVQERFQRDGADMLRVLVVAAPRAHIDDTLAVTGAAGLVVEAVDLVPFALVRCLAAHEQPGAGEVIVSVGAGLTSVVVQVGGVPQLVRTTAGGGGTITDSLAGQLSVDYEQAEAIKRTASPRTAEGQAATALIDEQLVALVREIVGSVDYFLAQTAGTEMRRIVLTGAGSLVPGLRERIRAASHLDVVPADALRHVTLGKTRLTPEQLVAATSTLAGPIGLAMAPDMPDATRLTGLLPTTYRERLAARRELKVSVAAVAAMVIGLTGMWVQRSFQVDHARAAAAQTQRESHLLETKAAAYGRYATVESALIKRSTSIRTALAKDTDASALLDQLTTAMPDDVWLQNLQLTMPGAKSSGSMSFVIEGTDPDAPAHWLEHLRAQPGLFASVWVGGISVDKVGTNPVVHFNSQVVLAPTVVSHRADQYVMPK